MTTLQQPGWYDDPENPNAQRYWDGNDWTPHRQRKPVSRPAQPPAVHTEAPTLSAAEVPTMSAAQYAPPPPGEEYPPPPSGAEYPPPPPAAQYPPPAPGGPSQPSRSPITVVMAVVALVAVLALAFVMVYKFVWHHSASSSSSPTTSEAGAPTSSAQDAPRSSAPRTRTHSAPGAPTHSAPGGSTNGGQTKYLNDLAAVGITSSTARPEALIARGQQACSDLAAGKSQDDAAADIVSSSNHFFDENSAENIVRMAVKDLCPQQH